MSEGLLIKITDQTESIIERDSTLRLDDTTSVKIQANGLVTIFEGKRRRSAESENVLIIGGNVYFIGTSQTQLALFGVDTSAQNFAVTPLLTSKVFRFFSIWVADLFDQLKALPRQRFIECLRKSWSPALVCTTALLAYAFFAQSNLAIAPEPSQKERTLSDERTQVFIAARQLEQNSISDPNETHLEADKQTLQKTFVSKSEPIKCRSMIQKRSLNLGEDVEKFLSDDAKKKLRSVRIQRCLP